MTASQIVALFAVLFHWALPPGVPEAVEAALRAHGGDAATVLAVCTEESAMGRRGRFLCGVRGGRASTFEAQASFAARAFPSRMGARAMRRRLVLWVCGQNDVCGREVGEDYARRVLGLRARIRRLSALAE